LSGFSVLVLVDFFVFELGDSLVGSVVVDSLAAAGSVVASDFCDFLLLLFVLLFDDGLVAVSAAGLFVVAGDLVVDDLDEGDAVVAGAALDFTVGLAAGVVVAATDAVAAGVIVPAGLALALVEAEVFVVVLGAVVVVAPVVVDPVVVEPVVVDALTPKVAGTVTP
jgi:hypothetical protein